MHFESCERYHKGFFCQEESGVDLENYILNFLLLIITNDYLLLQHCAVLRPGSLRWVATPSLSS